MIGDTKVTIDPRVAGSVAIKGIEERDGKVIVTLNDNTSKELVKFVDVKALIQNEYVHNMAGEKVYPVSLPEGFMMSLVGAVPNGWSVEIEGAGPETKIKVVYPQNGEAKLTFVVFVDGVSSSAYKVVTFKVSADAPPAAVWTPVIFDGSKAIVVPTDTEHIKVSSVVSVNNPTLTNFVCAPLKQAPNAKHIDLSELNHSGPIPANAFYMNANPNDANDPANFNEVIETIILPRNHNGALWGAAFKNCKALKSITFNVKPTNISENAFEGCTALESIFVPAEHVEAAKGLAGFTSVKDKIKAIPQ